MKLDALDHPKTLDFAARLNVELPTAIGYLELLWAFAAKKAPQGNVGKWPDGAIARACYWNADPIVFLNALSDAGFIDRDSEHRFLVHDWRDHAPGWIRAKLQKLKIDFLEATSEPTNEGTSERTSEPSTRARVPSLAKPSQAKGRETTAAARPDDEAVERLKAGYPKRAGAQPWGRALKACNARLAEGHGWSEILDGVSRYAAFVRTTGIEGTAYVLQAATFCGPEKHFLETWDPPPTSAEVRQNSNVQAGRDWLEAADAPF